MNRTDAAVIVVGAGPAGLSLALALGRAGVETVVLEMEPALTHDLRAGSYHPPTIEMLHELGVGEAMMAAGIVVPQWQVRDRVEGVIAEFDLGLLADETPFPFRLHLEQHRLTPMLLDAIERDTTSVRVLFSHAVERVEINPGEVVVHATAPDGPLALNASFVVGCDGARSVVRKALGVDFEGFTWPERFLVASTTYDFGPHGFAGAGYVSDPEHWCAVFNVPGDGPPGLWRVAYPTDPETPEETDMAAGEVHRRLAIIFENTDMDAASWELKYRSTYRVHQRVAGRFFAGRGIIAGDAAHLNNPMGGLGLNGSVHDAVNLAAKLVAVLDPGTGGTDWEATLDLYDRQRRPINVKAVQAMSIRNKKMIEEKDPAVRRRNNAELRATVADKAKARAFLMNTSMINSVREAAAIV
ncbi:MAG: FAD-dependent monooxygenase [Azospirillaceae bacterium]